ncbi:MULTISPECIES: hypothetical protein [unclassified Moorena]|uniref:hypothetical protein n=1 Tax=unclassified Moorena TaxID=2683338 RepID=UPI0013BF2501|nr:MULTISPECIES: hypothetical protein [unclassified Moorena]NEP30304.1 hypothetical protein [Moorena sp. SIO3B2]NEQ12445.1 hypothetical protein [Moorena sp. SIO3E2]NES80379.1 hypothetical protein [Moorena sp. SIO2B7]NET69001.1 hypothetical protein [Moorena sp. SIO1G6]
MVQLIWVWQMMELAENFGTSSATNRPPLLTFREYGLRFDIEESFLDDKSNGFELESCEIRNAKRLIAIVFRLGDRYSLSHCPRN